MEEINKRIQEACQRSGRSAGDVRLIGVTKKKSHQDIWEALHGGQSAFGENYLQEALEKINTIHGMMKRTPLKTSPEWHFIGRLQSKKCKHIPGVFAMVHSLDSIAHAEKLNEAAAKKGIKIEVLVQVNMDQEKNKGGVSELFHFLERCVPLGSLLIKGLMCIPKLESQRTNPHAVFASTRKLMEEANQKSCYSSVLTELSMGMSQDFEAAIAEGSTMVRLGTVLFGSR